MKRNPFFSVIIPTYNRANLLPIAIESVQKQTFDSWELLIIDDGSTDDSKEVVKRYANVDSRVKYFFQENAERSAARNNGIKHAQGRFICFLDSDDYYLTEHLSLLFDYIKNFSAKEDFLITGLCLETKAGIERLALQPDPLMNIFDVFCTITVHSQQVCILRERLKACNYNENLNIGEDLELWLRLANFCKIKFLTGQHTVVVKDHDERSVNVYRYNSGLSQLRTYRYIFSKNHPGKQVSKSIKSKLLTTCYFSISKYYITRHDKLRSAYWVIRAIFGDFRNQQTRYRVNVLFNIFFNTKKAELLVGYFR